MQTPQEISVWYILPSIRRELALALKKKKLSQKQIASILGVTEAAVSQYLRSKRARSIKLPNEILIAIRKSADNMLKDRSCHIFEIQKIMNLVKKTGFLCKIHRKHDNVPRCCTVCLEGEKKCGST
ncbi:helix-turn-helix domain-containing protein [Candidatus Woesearchaeota archaeon]|nr:helix-turn-helix domain-containing protein [Candidatus Woesearchaeota archaeon]